MRMEGYAPDWRHPEEEEFLRRFYFALVCIGLALALTVSYKIGQARGQRGADRWYQAHQSTRAKLTNGPLLMGIIYISPFSFFVVF
jgi:hypothetical protein